MSPLANHRKDEYGGSFENRVRFPLEVIRAVRAEIGQDVPLFFRISASDWVPGGWTVETPSSSPALQLQPELT